MAIDPPLRQPMEIISETEGDLGSKRMLINFGPQHPATHGTLRTIIELDGETVSKVDLEIGYLHSGFEKQSEDLSYDQGVVVSDRMNYLSPPCNNIGLSCAIEELMGIEVTPRCKGIRVIIYEMARLGDHILSVGLQAMDLGAFSVMLWSFIEREKIYDIFEAVTGARLTTSYTRVGGLMRDVPHDFDAMCRQAVKHCRKTIGEMEQMLNENKIFVDRCKGINGISKEKAISYGLTGPLLRACGVPYDLRRTRPYLGYEQYDFEVVTEEGGDVWARYRVRVREMYESCKIIEQALDQLPEGPIKVEDPMVSLPMKDGANFPEGGMEGLIFHFKNLMDGHGVQPPKGEVYFATEAPNGELGYYLVSDGSHKPYRWRVRPPSLYNYQAFPEMCEGQMLSDLVSGLASLNIIAGELDR